jgi:hypothetical protein
MKHLALAASALLSLVTTMPAAAQTLSAEKLFPQETGRADTAQAIMRGQMATLDLDGTGAALVVAQAAADEGKQKDVLILLPTVPVTFNALQQDSTGGWYFGNAMTAGMGVTFVLGKATFNGGSAEVDPWVIAGAAINAGIRESADRKVAEALNVSGFIGIGDVAVNISWPLLSGERSLGLALKVDMLTNMAPNAYMCFRGCGR